MDELIARLEAATKGCRALDGLVAVAVGWVFTGCTDEHLEHWEKIAGHWYTPEQRSLPLSERLRLVAEETRQEPPRYTTSADAAISLIPELIERCIQILFYPEHTIISVTWGSLDPFDRQTVEGRAATLPLAIVIAALKARQGATP